MKGRQVTVQAVSPMETPSSQTEKNLRALGNKRGVWNFFLPEMKFAPCLFRMSMSSIEEGEC